MSKEKDHGFDFDSHTGNLLSFCRTHQMGHDWICISATKNSFLAHPEQPSPFTVIHDPECPCYLEGVSIEIFGPGRKPTPEQNDLILSFEDEYTNSFTRNETEEWCDIVDRCSGYNKLDANVDVYIAVLLDRRIPVGALVAEHYRGSDVLLATYCFIKKAMRRAGRGYARRLVLEGTSEISRKAAIPKNGPRVLFECENPDLMSAENIALAPFDPRARLEWIKNLGARKLNFHYVQPPLSTDREAVQSLDLYCIGEGILSSQTLTAFLKEFYKAHEENVAPENKTFYHETLEKQLREIK